MNVSLPTVFISHGSPMHAIEAGRAGDAWSALGRRLERPTAVLVASAHWETELPMVGTSREPETIHDFGGFPPALYRIRYAAPGAPAMATRAAELLKSAGVASTTNGCRGLDHGAWVPLLQALPGSRRAGRADFHPAIARRRASPARRRGPRTAGRRWRAGAGVRTHDAQPARVDRRRAAPGLDDDRRTRTRSLRARLHRLGRRRAAARRPRRARALGGARAPRLAGTPHARAFPAADDRGGRRRQRAAVEHIDAGVDSGVLAMDAYLFWPRRPAP